MRAAETGRAPGRRAGTARAAGRIAAGLAATLALAAACGGSDDASLVDTVPESELAAYGADSVAARPDAEMQAVLDQLAALGPKPIPTLTPEEARRQPGPSDAVKALLLRQGKDTAATALVPGVRAGDTMIQGAVGRLPATVYVPTGRGAPFPVILYFHGGGWVIGNRMAYDAGARALAKEANAVVVSVEYRKAPEHEFPAQHDDAIAAYRWVLANAASIDGDPNRVAVAGESAGGNLALWTAIQARDANLQRPLGVLAVYPIAHNDTTTPSYRTYADAKPLGRPMMSWFFDKVTRTPADLADPRIDLISNNLRDLPPVTIVAAQIDPLQDDAAVLQRRLREAGNDVAHRRYEGVTHEFFGMGAVHPKAADAVKYGADRMSSTFGPNIIPAAGQ